MNLSEDGKYYSAFDGKIHEDGGRSFYTDDWIWDTYRATHPLRVLIDNERENDIINSYLLMAEQMGTDWMPTFPEGDGRYTPYELKPCCRYRDRRLPQGLAWV